MRHGSRSSRAVLRAAVAVGAAAVVGLGFTSSASAVTPQTATATYDCGTWGGGSATLTATQSGTAATITLTSAVTTPVHVGADSMAATLTLAKNGSGTTVFSGTKNPDLPAGSAVTIGPLTGTVAAGDSLDSYTGGTALSMTIFGVSVDCNATTAQSPGPFVF
ncbi:hypothetical protein OG760_35075 [Streptomyces sp. NBC_00963]|uniref:hypothetical protein n=1 Tax=Streptomyces sp. NBC_00963 TaxID=2903697 RepID=UPI003870ABC5|nr:hypothetical protein OG760_35075 [Streptomyces sp. NBC_00963]